MLPAVLVWLWLGGGLTAELSRLEGQQVTVADDGASYRIDDIAGEGAPRVGVVERRGSGLWLVEPDGAGHRLTGPLAIPRIAGPGYKIWVLGQVDGTDLRARRLGVLRAPE